MEIENTNHRGVVSNYKKFEQGIVLYFQENDNIGNINILYNSSLYQECIEFYGSEENLVGRDLELIKTKNRLIAFKDLNTGKVFIVRDAVFYECRVSLIDANIEYLMKEYRKSERDIIKIIMEYAELIPNIEDKVEANKTL